MVDNDDERDDIIRLFDREQNRVFSCTKSDVIIVEDFSEDEDTKLKATSGSHKSMPTILPAAFYDIKTNVDFLKRCRPLSIKLVDCKKFPHYYEKRTNSDEDIHRNSKSLLEPDCIDISSSDENDAYDIIVERKVSKDLADINKEFDRARFINAPESKSNHSETKCTISQDINITVEDKNGNCDVVLDGYNNFDVNSNRVNLSGDSILLSEKQYKSNKCLANEERLIKNNKETICEVTSKNKIEVSNPYQKRRHSQVYSQCDIEETYIDKIDTYARLIDKAYTNLQTKAPLIRNKTYDSVKNCNDQYKIQLKSHVTNKLDVKSKISNDKLKKYTKNLVTVKNNIASLIRNLKYEDDENVVVDKSINNNFKQFLRTKSDGDAYMQLYGNCKQEEKCTVDEVPQSIGSSSPILPCPTQVNKSIDPNIKNIAPVAPQYSFTKQNIEKELKKGVCENQFYSANRIIPHYHNEKMRSAKMVQPTSLTQNISKKSTIVEDIQIHNENILCKENDYIIDQRQLKQNEIVDGEFNDFIEISLTPITSANGDVPKMNVNNSTPLYNSKQEPYKFSKCKETLGRGVSMQCYSVISTVTNNESKYNFPDINEIANLKSQHPLCNETTSAFSFQSSLSNQNNLRLKDFPVNSNDGVALLLKPILNQNDINPNYVNNNLCNPASDLSCTQILQAPDDFNEYKQLYENKQALVTSNDLLKHQIGNSQILNLPTINNHYVKDFKRTLHVNNENTFMSKFHDHLLGTRNMYQRKRKSNYTSDDKYSTLKKHLNRAPLKLNSSFQGESIFRNNKSNQRIDKSKINKNQLIQQNKNTTVANRNITLISDSSFNTDEEKVIAALVATDYMTQKEENAKHKNRHITQSLNQKLQGVNIPDIKNTANGYLDQFDNSHMYGIINTNHSPSLYLKPRQQKTFELRGKIKVYDLEGNKQLESLRNFTEESTTPDSLKKGRLNNKESLVRKISINEYRQRQFYMKNKNYENKN